MTFTLATGTRTEMGMNLLKLNVLEMTKLHNTCIHFEMDPSHHGQILFEHKTKLFSMYLNEETLTCVTIRTTMGG